MTETVTPEVYTVPDATLQDLTTHMDSYLLGDRRTIVAEPGEDGSVKREIYQIDPFISTELESVTTPDGMTTYNYTRHRGPGSLMLSAAQTSLSWTSSSEAASVEEIEYGEIEDAEASSADYRKALATIIEEFGNVQPPVLPKRLNRWGRQLGRLVGIRD